MISRRKKLLSLVCALLAAVLLPITASAFTAKDYCIVFLSTNAPKDASMSLVFPEEYGQEDVEFVRSDRAWETYFRMYFFDNPSIPMTWRTGLPEGTMLKVEYGGESRLLKAPVEDLPEVRTLINFDFNTGSFEVGVPKWRAFMLVAVRVALCLVLETLIFFLFGFRRLRSWLVLSISAVLIQVFVCAGLFLGGSTLYDSYTGWALTILLLAEFFIFVIRTAVFDGVIIEHGGHRAAYAALVLNAISTGTMAAAVMLLPM